MAGGATLQAGPLQTGQAVQTTKSGAACNRRCQGRIGEDLALDLERGLFGREKNQGRDRRGSARRADRTPARQWKVLPRPAGPRRNVTRMTKFPANPAGRKEISGGTAEYEMKVQMIRSKGRATRLFVNVPLPLAAALELQAGERVSWELLDRSDLHLVRLNPPPPKKRSKK